MDEQAFNAYLKQAATGGRSAEEVAALREAYRVSGLKGYWRANLEQSKRIAPNDFPAFASMHAGLGEKEQAFGYLERTYRERRPFYYLKIDPRLDSLRADPRFIDLLRRVGL